MFQLPTLGTVPVQMGYLIGAATRMRQVKGIARIGCSPLQMQQSLGCTSSVATSYHVFDLRTETNDATETSEDAFLGFIPS